MFQFQLCLALGFPHPDYLLEMLTSEQLLEWEAYSVLDPIGKWREDYNSATICMTLSNIARAFSAKKDQPPEWKPLKDFMPPWSKPAEPKPKKQTVDQMKEAVLNIARFFGRKKKEPDVSDTRPPRKLRK